MRPSDLLQIKTAFRCDNIIVIERRRVTRINGSRTIWKKFWKKTASETSVTVGWVKIKHTSAKTISQRRDSVHDRVFRWDGVYTCERTRGLMEKWQKRAYPSRPSTSVCFSSEVKAHAGGRAMMGEGGREEVRRKNTSAVLNAS